MFNIVSAFIVYCFYPETAYLNLEAVDHLFIKADDGEISGEGTRKKKFLQWDVVPRAWDAVDRAKKARKEGLSGAQGGDVEEGDELGQNTSNTSNGDSGDNGEKGLAGGEKGHVELVK